MRSFLTSGRRLRARSGLGDDEARSLAARLEDLGAVVAIEPPLAPAKAAYESGLAAARATSSPASHELLGALAEDRAFTVSSLDGEVIDAHGADESLSRPVSVPVPVRTEPPTRPRPATTQPAAVVPPPPPSPLGPRQPPQPTQPAQPQRNQYRPATPTGTQQAPSGPTVPAQLVKPAAAVPSAPPSDGRPAFVPRIPSGPSVPAQASRPTPSASTPPVSRSITPAPSGPAPARPAPSGPARAAAATEPPSGPVAVAKAPPADPFAPPAEKVAAPIELAYTERARPGSSPKPQSIVAAGTGPHVAARASGRMPTASSLPVGAQPASAGSPARRAPAQQGLGLRALADPRARLGLALVAGLLLGFLSAHLYASAAEDRLDEIRLELLREPAAQSGDEFQLAVERHDLARSRMGRAKNRIVLTTGFIWLVVGAGVAYGVWRFIPTKSS